MEDKINVWIEPNGTVHHVGIMGHADYIKNYVERTRGTDLHTKLCEDLITCGGFSEAMHKRGWVRIMQWAWHDKPKVVHTLRKVPSHITRIITDLFIDQGYPVDESIF